MATKVPAQPSAEDIVRTFERLFAQATTNKISGWSSRTLSRAVGWAALAERTPAYKDRSAKVSLLIALGTNPSCPPDVLTEVISQLNLLGVNDLTERRELLEAKVVKSGIAQDAQASHEILAEMAAAELKRISSERALDIESVLELYVADAEWRERIRDVFKSEL